MKKLLAIFSTFGIVLSSFSLLIGKNTINNAMKNDDDKIFAEQIETIVNELKDALNKEDHQTAQIKMNEIAQASQSIQNQKKT